VLAVLPSVAAAQLIKVAFGVFGSPSWNAEVRPARRIVDVSVAARDEEFCADNELDSLDRRVRASSCHPTETAALRDVCRRCDR